MFLSFKEKAHLTSLMDPSTKGNFQMEKCMVWVNIIGSTIKIGMKDNTKIIWEMDLEHTITANPYTKVALGREEA